MLDYVTAQKADVIGGTPAPFISDRKAVPQRYGLLCGGEGLGGNGVNGYVSGKLWA